MLKHSPSLSTLDQQLFPGVREEKDTRLWLLRKWAFAIMLSVGLVLWSGPFWKTTGGKEIKTLAGKASLEDAPQNRLITGRTQASRHSKSQTAISETAKASMVIPRGTLIPVKIQSTRLGGLGRTVILARTRSYVLPDKTVLIPAGSRVQGIARRSGNKWEIHWNSVSIISAEGREAEIQAMNEIPAKASLYGRTLVVRTK